MKDSVKTKLSRVGASQITDERKKKDERITMNFETFKQLGKGRLRKLMQETPEKQAEVMAKLDPEAKRAFKGLMGLTTEITKKVEPKPPEPVPETVEEVFREVPAKVDAVFDLVRQLMTAMTLGEFKKSYDLVRALMANRDLDNSARTVLVPVGNAIARLYRDSAGTVALGDTEIEELTADINERLSNLVSAATYDVETIASSDFDFVGQIETDVPSIVEETCHVRDITLVVLPDRALPAGNRVRPLASGIYLVETTLIGVNTDLSEDDRIAAADAYAVKELKASVLSNRTTPIALTRPDSDAVWFPVFNHAGLEPIRPFAVDIVQFPDQARNYYGAATASNEMEAASRQAKLMRLRAQRAAFEAENAAEYAELNTATTEQGDCNSEALTLGAAFFERYNQRWQTPYVEMVAHFEALRDESLDMAADDIGRRYAINTTHERRMEQLQEDQTTIIDLRLRTRNAKKAVTRLTALLDERKRAMRDPYGVSIGDQIAALGKQQAA